MWCSGTTKDGSKRERDRELQHIGEKMDEETGMRMKEMERTNH